MDLRWKRQDGAVWDADKQRIVGAAPEGALDLSFARDGALLPGDWFVALDADRGDDGVVGYGWLDATWGGDAEICLAVDPAVARQGVGSFILGRLEQEAARRGLNYVYNTVRAEHPDHDEVFDWLSAKGYRGSTSEPTLRKRVEAESDGDRPERRATVLPAGSLPPGHEESGGYVDVDDHRY